MNLKIITFFILLQSEIYLCLKNTATHNPSQVYTITKDQKNAERKTSFYLENRYTRKGTVERLKFLFHEHICKTSPKMREVLCYELMESELNGFTFDSSKLPSKCKYETYTIQFLTLEKSMRSELSIFSCPPVQYTDLETGEQRTLPHKYKISTGRTYGSAILFIQEEFESKDIIHTQKYVKKIDFKNLTRTKILPLDRSEISKTTNVDIIRIYLQEKNATLPYKKFQQFYSSMNICGLRQAHRVHLCRRSIPTVLKHDYFHFDFLSFDRIRCRKYKVYQSTQNMGIINHREIRNELYMFRCPPLKTDHLFKTSESLHLYYVTSNLLRHSITLFSRDNDKRETPTLKFTFNGLKMKPIIEHNRRERFLPAQSRKIERQKSYQEIGNEIISLVGGVRTPSAPKQFDNPNLPTLISEMKDLLQFTRDRWFSEHVLVSFSKVKTNRFIYRRFMMTHKSIDICHLTTLQKILICNAALHDVQVPVQDEISLKQLRSTCSTKTVTLTVLEADDYETNQFSMCLCFSKDKLLRNYFLGKNHLKDSATIYKRVVFNRKKYYYPHSLITKIDRNKLKEHVRQLHSLLEPTS